MEEITENSAVTKITEMGGRMADQPGNPEIKERVADVRKPEKAVADQADQMREDPGTSSIMGKAVEEPGTAGVTENPIQEMENMKDIEGFEQRYIDEIESYADDLKKSPEVASGGSGFFYTVPIDEQSSKESKDLYVPVCAKFRKIREMLMIAKPDDNTKKQLRHYYYHLDAVLKRFKKQTPEDYLLAMKKKKEEIAKWYSDKGETTADFPQFLGLLLSGCFIIDLFHKWHWNEFSSKEDPECCHQWASELWVDLLLVENQIPLFILQDVINTSIQEDIAFLTLEKLVYYYYKEFVPLRKQPLPREALARFCCQATPPTGDTQFVRLMNYLERIVNAIPGVWQAIFYKYFRKSQLLITAVPTATRLQQAGIKFKPVGGKGFVAEFKHGVLRLPRLHVRRNTGKLLANLIAWEKCHHGAVKYFINYAIFMDYLVNTSKDIEILIQNKVLEHSLGTDEEVASVFNNLGKNLVYTINEEDKEEYDFLPQISKDLNNYCKINWHRWMSNLMSDYFKSPWSIISVIAGLLLILLTMAQTFFSAYSYFRPP
ncbi:UPF0481 protein At3g47200-like [Aristolochia californica]|uniref:UPF0481 protein At3g47200-like n=1 Tax=Aristolochia californica TaxID=171875 RepID=UPI0035D76250